MWVEFLHNIFMQVSMDEKEYTAFNSLSLTLATTFLSIGISVFTLSIAFIDSKKIDLKHTYDECEKGISLSLSRKINSLSNFIRIMTEIANLSLWNIVFSFVTISLSIIFGHMDYNIFVYIILIPITINIVLTVLSLWKLFRWYHKSHG